MRKCIVSTFLVLVLFGICVTGCKTYSPSFKQTKALANQGDATAQYNLGVMYANGEGVQQSYDELLLH
ncbi:MAG: hypothetical protein LE180_06470 [Endomicrobium sp.]|uniref:hypothetical protein n=1 Tax=Candidatus Endomicrobiellum pyrsonymphae TaxID=1408203 RepID=UPI0035826FB2|nr:hypothetical protein [Endomicrobium sp.]